LFGAELLNLINQPHGLVHLAAPIKWQALEAEWSPQFISPPIGPRCPRG
jgi:hypothetical protein